MNKTESNFQNNQFELEIQVIEKDYQYLTREKGFFTVDLKHHSYLFCDFLALQSFYFYHTDKPRALVL